MRDGVRDVRADYVAAHVEEYRNSLAAGRDEEAARIAAHLRSYYGHDVGHVERAVADDNESPEEPARRGPGRPRKDATQ